ncbi:MAG: heavy metal-binding domain-containing protein, partial [Acetobacteraceae bacterium]
MTDILVVTTDVVANARVTRVIGTVFGTSIRSRSALGNAFGNMRAAFGGGQLGYVKLMNETRTE